MSIKKDIEYALVLLAIQEEEDFFDENEPDNNDDFIKEILLVLSSLRYLVPRNYVIKSQQWWYEILPLYDDTRFKKVLRMERQQFNKLVQVLQNDTIFQNKGNKPQASVNLQLAIFLRRLGTKDDILSICSRFGISEGTVILYVNRVIKAIRNKKSEFIQWPRNDNRAIVHAGFQAIGGFQNVVGAIDGTHFILSEAPAQDPTAFFTRKKRYALHCQGIVDFRGIFINYVVGWPGSVHDARVYANSDFFLNKSEYIEGDDYILGDSAYPISPFLISPFKNPSNYRHRQFNFIHSKHRVAVENAFSRLKARFKALKELSVKDLKTAIKLAECAILLHNFLENCGDVWEINDQDVYDNNDQYDWEDESDEILKLEGELKRERMLNIFVA
jgi:hypothetical protein